MRVSPSVLVAVSAIALPLALTAPLYSLLLLNVLLVAFQGQTQIGGVLLDPSDVILAALAFGFLFRKRLTFREIRKQVPLFAVWVSLALLMSVAYLTADKYQQHLTAIHRVIYQVYRFAWKPIMFYPLAAILLNNMKSTRHALTAIVVAGDICALMALPQGLGGIKAEGPFQTGNSLGAALIAPFVIAVGMTLMTTNRKSRWFYFLSLLLLGRVLLWAGSRGATAGVVLGLLVFFGVLASRATGRSRLLRLVPMGLAGILLLLALKPDFMTRPTIRRAMTIKNPMEESTLQWRIENRWGFFWDKSLQSPWFGFGTDVDVGLTAKGGAKTPHNGYLSLLVTYGFPATFLYILFGLIGVGQGIRVFRQSGPKEVATSGLVVAAAIVGILTHNSVESVFTNNDWVNLVYWLLAGIGATLALQQAGSMPDEEVVLTQPRATRNTPALAARQVIST